MINLTGEVFNIQHFSTEDGPGIRTTVFLKGCPLRCIWCANPESQCPRRQAVHRNSLCIGCGRCMKACPEEAICMSALGHEISIDRNKCNNCGACIDVCAAGAMKFFGKTMTVDEVLCDVKKDAEYYSSSQGGITVSGGEPLVQADFVSGIFRRSRNIGIHTALDTSGFFEPSALEKVWDFTDLVLFDIKLMNRLKHVHYTGVDNKIILQNARLIARKGISMIIRVPVIPGVNDSEENLTDTARFVTELSNKPSVNLLPYHNYGENKHKMLDMDYRMVDTKRPSGDHLLWCQSIFEKYGLDCEVC